MSDAPPPSRRPDDLGLPWIFVPHGTPDPVEWMRSHPGWIRLPATFVPHEAVTIRSLPEREADPSPFCDHPVAPVTIRRNHGADVPAAMAAVAVAPTGIIAAPSWALTPAMEAVLARIAAAMVKGLPVVGFAGGMWPRSTAADDQIYGSNSDGNPYAIEQRQRAAAMRHDAADAPAPEGFTPAPPAAPSEALVPPDHETPREGFVPAPPPDPVPGFTAEDQKPQVMSDPVVRLPEIIVHAQETSETGPRRAARISNPEVFRILDRTEIRAHHLANRASERGPAKDVIAAAKRAGWKMDGPENMVALPATPEAQEKLKQAGIDLPVHNSGHPATNKEFEQRALRIEQELRRQNYIEGTEIYDRQARKKLEEIINGIRENLVGYDRLGQIEPTRSDVEFG